MKVASRIQRVAVVPVALAARRLGQRGGGRGDERAGRRVRQALERQRAALEVGAPGVVGEVAVVEPVLPVVRGPDEPLVRLLVGRVAAGARTRRARRTACRPPSSASARSRAGPRSPAACRWSGGARSRLLAGARDGLVVARPVYSQVARDAPVVEARLAVEVDLHLAVHAAHDAEQHVVGVVVGRRAPVRCTSARPRGATAP